MRRRLLMMVTAAGLVVMAGLVGVLAGSERLAGAALVLLAGAAVVLLLDLRRRSGESAELLRRAAQRDRALAQQVAELSRAFTAIDGPMAAVVEPVRRALGPDGQVEQMERRILGSFEAERLRAADRHRELQAGVDAAGSQITSAEKTLLSGQKRAVTALTAVARDETRQVEALLQIVPNLAGRQAMLPPSGRWAMDARSIGHLIDLVRTHRPTRVVELGSGTSSVWLGYSLRELQGTLVSVDHDAHFGGLTREALARHGLDDLVEVRVAPLTEHDGIAWYDRSVISDLADVDLLVVDGPPGSSGPRVRGEAVPFFAERLSPGALVVLDDSDRPDESAIAEEWTERFGLERIDTGVSRLAVLRRPSA